VKTFVAITLLSLAPVVMGQAPAGSKALRSGIKDSAGTAAVTAKPSTDGPTKPGSSQDAAAKPAQKVDPAKDAAIRKLFDVQGTRKAMEEVIAGISANMKPTLAQSLPPGDYQGKLIDLFFQKFQSKVKVDDLIEVSIPVYDKYFSKEDITGLIAFYQTPLGQKMNSVLPKVIIETQTAAAAIGQELGRQSMLEVLAEHPELAKALEEASKPKN
jgi:uncharacterized protein